MKKGEGREKKIREEVGDQTPQSHPQEVEIPSQLIPPFLTENNFKERLLHYPYKFCYDIKDFTCFLGQLSMKVGKKREKKKQQQSDALAFNL